MEVLLEYKADVNLQDNASWPLFCDVVDWKGVWLEAVIYHYPGRAVEGTVLCVHRN